MTLLMCLLEKNGEYVDSEEVAQSVVPLIFKMCEAFDFDIFDVWNSPEDDIEQATIVYGSSISGSLCDIVTPEVFLKYAFPLIQRGLQATERSEDSRRTPAWVRNFGALTVMEHVMVSVAHVWAVHQPHRTRLSSTHRSSSLSR